jgi:hypothetical protein
MISVKKMNENLYKCLKSPVVSFQEDHGMLWSGNYFLMKNSWNKMSPSIKIRPIIETYVVTYLIVELQPASIS